MNDYIPDHGVVVIATLNINEFIHAVDTMVVVVIANGASIFDANLGI